jgi:hypothetical protein
VSASIFEKWSHRNTAVLLNGGIFMARPKKETEQKVKNLIMLRLTDTQYEIVCEYARLMGLPPAVYVRKIVTEGRHPIRCNIVRNDEKIDKLIAQLSRVGNNLNQITRFFNQGGSSAPEIVKEIREAIRQIYDMSEVLDQIESDTSYGSIETHSE